MSRNLIRLGLASPGTKLGFLAYLGISHDDEGYARVVLTTGTGTDVEVLGLSIDRETKVERSGLQVLSDIESGTNYGLKKKYLGKYVLLLSEWADGARVLPMVITEVEMERGNLP